MNNSKRDATEWKFKHNWLANWSTSRREDLDEMRMLVHRGWGIGRSLGPVEDRLVQIQTGWPGIFELWTAAPKARQPSEQAPQMPEHLADNHGVPTSISCATAGQQILAQLLVAELDQPEDDGKTHP